MSVANYAALKTAVADWLDRSDLTATVPDFITLAEATLNRVVRNTRMVVSGYVAITAGSSAAPLPATLLEPIYLRSESVQTTTLEQIPIDKLSAMRRFRLRNQGTPRYYAVVGRYIELAPVPSGNVTAILSYYEKIPALSDAAPTNWLLTYQPDLYLYAALMHAAPYLKDDQRAEVFGNQLVQMIQGLLKENATASFEVAA